ncbi:PREDICTED: protein tweety homolog 2-like [Cyprinodon variegatus]|uniref:protein tweety homolog 2-like n=1 Tax=Cyprinodon variegatus TaxID=28743 RepID=UPI0007425CE3|nr:PREDICTED: protein tweety homolog 2-like [Cyprinodon variegatus]
MILAEEVVDFPVSTEAVYSMRFEIAVGLILNSDDPKDCCHFCGEMESDTDVNWTYLSFSSFPCSISVGVGFYGNSETNDGVYQLTYSLYNANHTLGGVDSLVTGTMSNMRTGLHQHLARLDEIFAMRGDYVQTLQFMQQMANNVIKQLLGLPNLDQAKMDLATVANQTAHIEYYR